MAKEKKTRFVLLGFLLNDSLSGYEMGELIKQSTNNFWKESDASIYPTLKLLAKEELVTSKSIFVGKRKKEVFTITSKGKTAFLEWFQKSPDLDWHREEFLLKFFFTDESTQTQMQQHCQDRLQKLEKLQGQYKEIKSFLKEKLPNRAYWLKTLQIGIAHLETVVEKIFVDFGDYFTPLFDSFSGGGISTSYITPPKMNQKSA